MKGILFKPDMFAATIAERKTETRRTGHFDKKINEDSSNWALRSCGPLSGGRIVAELDGPNHDYELVWPRYQPGEIVYIKEPYSICCDKHLVNYKYDNDPLEAEYTWENKLFMPEKYARYFIRIKAVLAERLHDITDEAAIAEGIEETKPWPEAPDKRRFKQYVYSPFVPEDQRWTFDPRESYIGLFISINYDTNKLGSFIGDYNPWVWVYKYELYNQKPVPSNQ